MTTTPTRRTSIIEAAIRRYLTHHPHGVTAHEIAHSVGCARVTARDVLTRLRAHGAATGTATLEHGRAVYRWTATPTAPTPRITSTQHALAERDALIQVLRRLTHTYTPIHPAHDACTVCTRPYGHPVHQTPGRVLAAVHTVEAAR
jgi:predicted ArsR family transcriptional regulator